MTAPDNQRYRYEYDADNNLGKFIFPDGVWRQYLYNEASNTSGTSQPHALTGIIDENGARHITYLYDAQGHAVAEYLAGNANDGRFALSYNIDNFGAPNSTVVTDPLGTARTYTFQTILGVVKSTGSSQPGGSGCGAAASAVTYDANGNIASRTDFNGVVTIYTYDLTRNLETSRTEAYGTPQARTITTAWHPSYRLPTQINEAGRTTIFSYDERGNLLQKTRTSGSQSQTWRYSYNQWGQILSVDGPRNDVADVTSYGYDTQGNLVAITNALGHTTQITAYDANGRPLTLIDPNQITTELRYDARGRLIWQAVANEVTTYAYDPVGQLIQLTRPDGSALIYTYDPAHRLIAISDGLGNRIAYVLDAMGNRLREDITDPNGTLARTRSQAYDALGRLYLALDSLNHATAYTYDANGNQTSITDPNGATTRNSYDPLGRLIQTLDPMNGATRTGYDSLDQVVSVTDPIGVTTAYQVDGLGNVTQEYSPDSGSTASAYDASGNLVSRTDATGQTLGYAYDALNRLVQISQGGAPLVTYTWDTIRAGKLSGFYDLTGSTQYQYDFMGRVSSKTQNGPSQGVSYTWATGNLLTQLTTPGGNQISYAYANGQISTLSVNGQTILTNIHHDPHGPISGWTWGNGQPHLRTHGLDGETQRIESAIAQTYGYDTAGRLTSQHLWSQTTPPQNDTQNSYTLDPQGRLSSAQTQITQSPAPISHSVLYDYDANGNRRHKSWDGIQTSYTYNANQLTQRSGSTIQSYTWDAAGRMTGDGNYTYTYNALGRLASIKNKTSALANYQYNALGQRLRKVSSGGVVKFAYDESGHLLGEYDSLGLPKQEIVWLEDLPVASLRPRAAGGTDIYYIHPDHLGTPRQITDSQNRIVWRWDSVEPFGTELPNEDPDGDGVKFEFNLRFPGQYYDKETGRHYNWFRDYDPGTGRYTTSDPIGLMGGNNRWTYVDGNPVAFTDPTGESSLLMGLGIGALGVGAVLMSPPAQSKAAVKALSDGLNKLIEACKPDDECDPPAGVKFNKVTHYASHSDNPEKGSHGCMAKTGSPVHWHYDVNDKAPNGKCYTRKHVFGGCGVAP